MRYWKTAFAVDDGLSVVDGCIGCNLNGTRTFLLKVYPDW